MSEERKKIIRTNANRKDMDAKLREALAKKPTASHINTFGINPKQTNPSSEVKSKFLNERLVRNAKNRKRFNNRPQFIQGSDLTSGLSYMEGSTYDGVSSEYPTPDWFRSVRPVDVSIIIPLYKSDGVIQDLIRTFPLENRTNIEKRLSWEIIFIDDKCPKNSKDVVLKSWMLRKNELKHPIGKIIQNSNNKGYGQSCNAGVSFASGKYLIFLNADTRVTQGWIEPMIELFEDKKVGLVGNMHIKDGGPHDGTIDSAGSEWRWEDMSFVHIARHSYNKKGIGRPFTPENCPSDLMKVAEREMVTGCCFAMKTDLYKYIGGFNPNYKIGYWEDSEICMNVRELGYKIMYQPKSVIYHKLGHTSSGGHKYFGHNRSYFMNKWVKSHRIDPLLLSQARPETERPVNKILLRRLDARGDALVAAGVCAALKKKYPNTTLSFTTNHADVIKGNPYIDEIVEPRHIHSTPFDLYYNLDLCYEWRPNVNILNAYAEAVGVNVKDCKVHVEIETFDFDLPEDYVVIHPGKTNWAGRDWPHDKFEELSIKLMNDGINVVSIGKHSEKEIPCTINLCGKTSIGQMGYVIQKSRGFIGIDSMPMHVAMAVDTPGVSIFGCIRPDLRIYNSKMIGITAKSLSCLGCHHRKTAPSTVTKTCEIGTNACLTGVTVEEVYSKFLSVIREKNYFENNIILG